LSPYERPVTSDGENRLESLDNASIRGAALLAAAVGTVTGILNIPKL
jgi:hypothetical protein